jgi:hypothetical protein
MAVAVGMMNSNGVGGRSCCHNAAVSITTMTRRGSGDNLCVVHVGKSLDNNQTTNINTANET